MFPGFKGTLVNKDSRSLVHTKTPGARLVGAHGGRALTDFPLGAAPVGGAEEGWCFVDWAAFKGRGRDARIPCY